MVETDPTIKEIQLLQIQQGFNLIFIY